jgi:hypothetical protein
VLDEAREIPAWIDDALRRAVHPDPARRTAELSELVYDLRQPDPGFAARARPALLERNPVAFWKGICAVLAAVIVALLLWRR